MKKNPYMFYNDRKHKNPAPEEMTEGIPYAFTWNPKRQPLNPQFKLDLITWHNGMTNILSSCKYCHIVLRPELSQGSRWHYHGHITIKNIMKFFIYDLPLLREEGTHEIDTITDKIIWEKYITKQEELMKQITKECLIPYIHDNEQIMKVKKQPLNDTKFTELLQYNEESEPDEATSTRGECEKSV